MMGGVVDVDNSDFIFPIPSIGSFRNDSIIYYTFSAAKIRTPNDEIGTLTGRSLIGSQ